MFYAVVVHGGREGLQVLTYTSAQELRDDLKTVPAQPGEHMDVFEFSKVGDEAEAVDPNSSVLEGLQLDFPDALPR